MVLLKLPGNVPTNGAKPSRDQRRDGRHSRSTEGKGSASQTNGPSQESSKKALSISHGALCGGRAGPMDLMVARRGWLGRDVAKFYLKNWQKIKRMEDEKQSVRLRGISEHGSEHVT